MVAVPFYKNPHLVWPLFESLRRCQDELASLNARLVFYNDSPGEPELQAELQKAFDQRQTLNLTIVENRENLGFVGTINQAFDEVVETGGDILILNSDTQVFGGTFRELVEVAYSDPMIGFVCPRSNNATLATFPHGSDIVDLPPAALYERFRVAARLLPRLTYAPVAVGYCLYIKGQILRDFGGFDVAYGKGYNEENDLICRANQYGYRAVLANHAFTYHKAKQSFAVLGDEVAVFDAENSERLYSRYPHYLPWVRRFFDSPEYYAERVLPGLAPGHRFRQRIGLDFSHFGAYHNGTFEHGKRLLEAADEIWPADVEIVVIGFAEALEFHGVRRGDRVSWIDPHDPDVVLTAVFRLGQIFDADSMWRLLTRAPVVGVWMLDTIAADCGYLRSGFDEDLWFFTMQWADVVAGNSQFTADQLRRRYLLGDHTRLAPVLLSTRVEDYAPADGAHAPPRVEGGRPSRLLVIGNKFLHKGAPAAVQALAEGLPDTEIVALGLQEPNDRPNVRQVATGLLTDAEMDALYREVDAVVFPTHYEGFGLPLMHALARRRPIYVRRIPVFEEIARSIRVGAENIRWFSDHQDLLRQLDGSFQGWRGDEARGEANGWARCAQDVYIALQQGIASASYDIILSRFRWFQGVRGRPAAVEVPPPPVKDPVEAAADFVALKSGALLRRILRNRFIYTVTRSVWRVSRLGR